MAQPTGLDPRQLLPVAMTEAVVISSVALRFLLKPGEVDLSKPLHLGWLLGCIALAAVGVAFFVVRSAALLKRQAAGEDTTNDGKQVLAFSIALMVPALALSFIGPRVLESLMR